METLKRPTVMAARVLSAAWLAALWRSGAARYGWHDHLKAALAQQLVETHLQHGYRLRFWSLGHLYLAVQSRTRLLIISVRLPHSFKSNEPTIYVRL